MGLVDYLKNWYNDNIKVSDEQKAADKAKNQQRLDDFNKSGNNIAYNVGNAVKNYYNNNIKVSTEQKAIDKAKNQQRLDDFNKSGNNIAYNVKNYATDWYNNNVKVSAEQKKIDSQKVQQQTNEFNTAKANDYIKKVNDQWTKIETERYSGDNIYKLINKDGTNIDFDKENEKLEKEKREITKSLESGTSLNSAVDNGRLIEIENRQNEIYQLKQDQDMFNRISQYNYIQKHGTEEEKQSFDRYVVHDDDGFMERTVSVIASTAFDTIASKPATFDFVKTILSQDAEDFLSDENLSTQWGKEAELLRQYAFDKAGPIEQFPLKLIQTMMPMINEIIIGTAFGLGSFTGRAVTAGMSVSAGVAKFREDLENGYDVNISGIHAVAKGVVTAIVEGLNMGDIGLLTGDAEKYLMGASFADSVKYFRSLGHGEGKEELWESGLDYITTGLINKYIKYENLKNGTDNPLFENEIPTLNELASEYGWAFASAVATGIPAKVSVDITTRAEVKYGQQIVENIRKRNEIINDEDLRNASENLARTIENKIAEFEKDSVSSKIVKESDAELEPIPSYEESMSNFISAFKPETYEQTQAINRQLENIVEGESLIGELLQRKGVQFVDEKGNFKGGISTQDYLSLSDKGKANIDTFKNSDLVKGIVESGKHFVFTTANEVMVTENGRSLPIVLKKANGEAINNGVNYRKKAIFINPEVANLNEVSKHEVFHSFKEKYQAKLAEITKKLIGQEAWEEIEKDVRKRYSGFKENAIQEEITANAIEKAVGNEEFLKKFRETDVDLFEKLYNGFKNKMNEFEFNRLYRKAFINATSNSSFSFGDYDTMLSMKSMESDLSEGKMIEDLVKVGILNETEALELEKNLKDLIEYMRPYREIVDMNEETEKDERKFKAYKPNSDPLYKLSLDFSTLCQKRLLTQAVIEQLQLKLEDKNGKMGRPLTSEETFAVRDMLMEYSLQEKALQVQCAMCYVEAARLKSPAQIENWLADPSKPLTSYFAKQNEEFKQYVDDETKKWKVNHGYDENIPKTQMKSKDKTALTNFTQNLRKGYTPTTSEMEIIDRAKSLGNEVYLTAANLANLMETEPVIYKAYTEHVRNSTKSKGLETDIAYYYGDSNGIVSDTFIENANRENGFRFQSWSDFQMKHMLDLMSAVIDLSVRKSKMHGYTKFPAEARIFGKTGAMFNLSGVPDGTGLLQALTDQKSFNREESLALLSFSPTESVNVLEALEVRDQFPNTSGLQCIGINDDHIRALLRSEIIDYVIPYHVSGLKKILRKMVGIENWDKYELTQHAKVDESIKDGDKENWHKEPEFSEFFLGYNTGMSAIEVMRKSADNYVKMCQERGLTPKFAQFLDEENYWKLLIDRKMIAQDSNGLITSNEAKLIEQKPVKPDFDFETIMKEVNREVDNYDAELQNKCVDYIASRQDEIPQRIKELKKGGKSAFSKPLNTLSNEMNTANTIKDDGVRYSRATDSDGNVITEEQNQYFKDSKIRDDSGNLLVVYHGTDAEFTTFDRTKTRANMDIQGNFFSPWDIDAGGYGSNVRAFYLNIKNPAPGNVAYAALNRFKGQNEAGVKAREYLESLGYDGVNNYGEEYIAFYPEQIKLVENQKPTVDPDIRYSKATDNPKLKNSIAYKNAEKLVKSMYKMENVYGLYKNFNEYISEKPIDSLAEDIYINRNNWYFENKSLNEDDGFKNGDYTVEEIITPYIEKARERIKNKQKAKEESVKKLYDYPNPKYDSDGNKLTKAVKDYFSKSKVVDDNGNLKVMYHGSPEAGFTKFKKRLTIANGFFFTDSLDLAAMYGSKETFAPESRKYSQDELSEIGGSKSYKCYLNVTNPFIVDADGSTWDSVKAPKGMENLAHFNEDTGEDGIVTTNEIVKWARKNGYDGVFINNVNDPGMGNTLTTNNEVIVFESNQIKSVNNLEPTENDDIRYSKVSENLSNDYDTPMSLSEDFTNKIEELNISQEEFDRVVHQKKISEKTKKAIEDNAQFFADNVAEWIPDYDVLKEKYAIFNTNNLNTALMQAIMFGEVDADVREKLREDIIKNDFDGQYQGKPLTKEVNDFINDALEYFSYDAQYKANKKELSPIANRVAKVNEAWNDIDIKDEFAKQQRLIETQKVIDDYNNEALRDKESKDLASLMLNAKDKVSRTQTFEQNADVWAHGDSQFRKRIREKVETPKQIAQAKMNMYRADAQSDVDRIHELGIDGNSKESIGLQYWLEKHTEKKIKYDMKTKETIDMAKMKPYEDYTEEQLKKDYSYKMKNGKYAWENIKEASVILRDHYNYLYNALIESQILTYGDVELKQNVKLAELLADVNKKAEALKKISEKMKGKDSIELQSVYNEELRRLNLAIDKFNSQSEKIANNDAGRRQLTPFRQNYAHHIQDSSFFNRLNRIFTDDGKVPTELSGISDESKPFSAWSSFMAAQEGGSYKPDAINGFLSYVNDASKTISYNPYIAEIRNFAQDIRDVSKGTTDASKIVEYLDDYANDIAGKTSSIFDRGMRKLANNKVMRVIDLFNSQAKKAALQGNFRSGIVQLANIPNGLGVLEKFGGKKFTLDVGKGAMLYASSIGKETSLMDTSTFLQNRFFDSNNYDSSFKAKLNNLTDAMMTIGDEVGTKIIWCSAYAQAERIGLDKLRSKGYSTMSEYADDIARRSVAGRGVGEVPLAFKDRTISLLVPFQIETNNAWQTFKENIRDIGNKETRSKAVGALLTVQFASYLFNVLFSSVTGLDDEPLPDFITPIIEEIKKGKDLDETVEKITLGEIGELLSMMPGSSFITNLTVGSEASKKILGDYSPNRYETKNIGFSGIANALTDTFKGDNAKALEDLFEGYAPGGKQIIRTKKGLQSMGAIPKLASGEEGNYVNFDSLHLDKDNVVRNSKGNIQWVTDDTDPINWIRATLFGKYATKQSREYYDKGGKALSNTGSSVFDMMAKSGLGVNDAFQVAQENTKTTKESSADLIKYLEDNGMTDDYIQMVEDEYEEYKKTHDDKTLYQFANQYGLTKDSIKSYEDQKVYRSYYDTYGLTKAEQEKFQEAIDIESTYKKDGTKVRNSEQLATRKAYEEMGQYENLLSYIEKNGLELEDFGLGKGVVNMDADKFAKEYAKVFGGSTGTTTKTKTKSTKSKKTTTKKPKFTKSSLTKNNVKLEYSKVKTDWDNFLSSYSSAIDNTRNNVTKMAKKSV